jgi:hypothetical protein
MRHMPSQADRRKPDPGRTFSLHRNAPVICFRCGRAVPRQARQQKFCSARCREAAKQRSRKAFLGQDTGAPPNPPKKVNGFNILRTQKNGSSIPQNLRRTVIEAEAFGGRKWRQVTSSGGVVCEVSTLRKRALCDGGAS